MAVVSVTEIWDSRGSEIDEKLHRRYTRTFRVKTNLASDGSLQVRAAPGIPSIFDPYVSASEYDFGSWAKTISSAQSDDDPFTWHTTVKYDTDLGLKNDPAQQQENPLDRPAEIEWDFASYQKPAFDINGAPLLNSAKEKFDPPVEIDDSRPVLKITRNEATYDPLLGIIYQDAINSDSWFGALPRQAKIAKISAKRKFENGLLYYEVSYELHFRRETWALKVLDHGFCELDSSGKPQLIRDDRQTPLSTAVLLDGNGHRLAPGGTPVFKTFDVYQELPFAALNLI